MESLNCTIDKDKKSLIASDNNMQSKGYRIKGLTHYGNNSSLFAAIWSKQSQKSFFKTNLTPGELEWNYDCYRNMGYQLSCLEGYKVEDDVLYA
ncbi:MAG: hypothetical protein IH946_05100, partial [Bacteroidetes bacterium]|nr:hypothetical protein [Bacteroidota bacterium]